MCTHLYIYIKHHAADDATSATSAIREDLRGLDRDYNIISSSFSYIHHICNIRII